MSNSRPLSSNRQDNQEAPFNPPTADRSKPKDTVEGAGPVVHDVPPLGRTAPNASPFTPGAPYPNTSNFLSVSSNHRPRANTAATFPSPPLIGPEILRPSTRGGPPGPVPPAAMYQSGQRDPSRPFQVPPPPPPMSPPVAPTIAGGMVIPPPPPRFPGAPGAPGVMLGPVGVPPPPGPPPGSALGQQAPWHNTWGRMYNNQPIPGPPPPPGQHLAYIPAKFITSAAGQTIQIPPPPPPSEQMSATYIPQGGDTYGEGVGIPGFGGIADEAATYSATTQSSWGQTPTTSQASDSMQLMTPQDENARGLYAGMPGSRGASTSSNAAGGVPAELAAQWPLDRVLLWLQGNQFSQDWQETFKGLNLHGPQFLELGIGHGGRGNFGMMHQQVYPRLAQECTSSGTGWDQPREREEGKRMRRLVRSIVTGRPLEVSRPINTHGRKESVSGAPNVLPSAGTDPGDSPNVSCSLPLELSRPYDPLTLT